MDQDMPHSDDLRPGSFGVLFSESGRERTGCLADNLQMVQDPILNKFVTLKGFSPPSSVFFDPLNRLVDVEQPLTVVPHNGTASRSTRSLMRSRSPFSATTSTLQPRTSTSLSNFASPRATEPKMRTFRAPCWAAMRRISSRLTFKTSSIPISHLFEG